MIKEPSSCNVSDCSVFVGIDTNRGNDEFLNVYMEANAEAWVAVGFSNSANMVSVWRRRGGGGGGGGGLQLQWKEGGWGLQ